MAKTILDEIQNRLRLVSELRAGIAVAGSDEAHELQPLFTKGLWMLGPQFESIEFTPNPGMSAVIRDLFQDKSGRGSRGRSDFVVLPDGGVGLYARPAYDKAHNQNGIEHVIIVDLKTTRLSLGTKETQRTLRYIKELRSRGHIGPGTRVDGFILGSQIEPGEEEPYKVGAQITMMPMLYDTMLRLSERRLIHLSERVREAALFLEQRVEIDRGS